MKRFSLVAALLVVFILFPHDARSQSWDFVGEWKISLVKRYPPGLEIPYPVRISIHQENGKLSADYTDQLGYSDKFSVFVVQQNEVLFVVGGVRKKNIEIFGPVHRAILK